jgi:hypothetical protein
MSRLRTAVCGLLLTVSTIGAPGPRTVKQNFGRPRAVPIAETTIDWPDLTARSGPYGDLPSGDEARAIVADGLNLAVLSAPNPDVVKPLRENGGKYIDAHLWRLVFNVCLKQFAAQTAAGQPRACVISPADQAAITATALDYLKIVEREPALAGFWILDDYPHGDVTAPLLALKNLIQQSNGRSGVRRPTLCGVGGSLDVRRRPEDTTFTSDHGYLDQALGNVSPAICDLVSPYFYGSAPADDPRLLDWSMQSLLPYFQQALITRGFAAPSRILVPVAQAFSHQGTGGSGAYVKPRAADVADQMTAYCDAGAIAMLFFTWESPDADHSYANDSDLRDGVRRGRLACVKTWRRRFGVP